MLQSNRPQKFLTPFAQGDTGRAEIPLTNSDSARASQTLGFPPLTGTPPEAGGVPPQREDMNGALNQVARIPWWAALGGRFPFDADFAGDAAINGYPQYAVLPATQSAGEWYSQIDNNSANPETTAADWVPGYHYGATALTGQTGGSVVLTPNQAAKRLITVAGTLTGHLVITVPAWLYAWDFINNTGGAFTVSVKYPSSGAVAIPQTGTPVRVLGDGSAVQVANQIVPAATNTVAGIQRNATNAEASAGTLTGVTVTPASLAAAALRRNQNLADLSAPATARTNLGLGSVALLNAIAINNVTGLQTALDGKLSVSQPTAEGTLTLNSAGTPYGGVGSAGAATAVLFASGGGVYLRPNGRTDPVGQLYVLASGAVATSGSVTVAGSVTASGGFQDGSSRTIKHHIDDLTPDEGLAAVLALQGVRYCYHWGDTARLGYYAEDTRPVIPEAVAEGGEGGPSPLLIEDTQMLPHHTGAIQALHRMITELQARVAELENQA